MVKRIIITSLVVLVFAASAVAYLWLVGDYSKNKKSEVLCNSVEVSILDSAIINIISKEEILSEIENNYPLTGIRMDSIDLNRIEKLLTGRGEIHRAEAYGDLKGRIHVEVMQRMPVVRIENNSERYYSSAEGFLFPVKSNVDVPIVTGHIPMSYGRSYKGYVSEGNDSQWLGSIIRLSKYISSDEFLSNQIEQINVDKNGDLVIYTQCRGPRINFGCADDFKNKFRRLEAYYKCIVPEKGEDFYKEVNVSFRGQIICK